MASVTAINDPGSLTYRFIGRPLLWGLRKVNPFGGSTEEGEKEEAIWKRVKGKEYVHLPLLEVRLALAQRDSELSSHAVCR
jgi:charged multivesicular body protein 7